MRQTMILTEEDQAEVLGHSTLDEVLSCTLTAVEREAVPSRLLKLAGEMQQELSFQAQRRRPN